MNGVENLLPLSPEGPPSTFQVTRVASSSLERLLEEGTLRQAQQEEETGSLSPRDGQFIWPAQMALAQDWPLTNLRHATAHR